MGFLILPNVDHPNPPISYIWGGEFGDSGNPKTSQFGEFGEVVNQPPFSGTNGCDL